MFDKLTQGFKDAALKLKGQARLTEENLQPAIDAVKRSLLEADVDFKVTKEFVENLKLECLNKAVHLKAGDKMKVSPGDHFIKMCYEKLVVFLGGSDEQYEENLKKKPINENPKGPTVILMAGLQGAGKTTHCAKLAKFFKDQYHKKPLLVAADVYRPAARDQLQVLADKIEVPMFTKDTKDVALLVQEAMLFAREQWRDLVIIDTAGRLAIDETLMKELQDVKEITKPQNILLVIDAMIGQDAVKTASAFHKTLGITGVVLTKADGDTRGGAALSVKKVIGQNILFLGTGEQLEKIELFRPEGMASRILGMGDIVGLMEDFDQVMDEKSMASAQDRMMKGVFDFNDFYNMTSQLQRMGSIKDIAAKMPGLGATPEQLSQIDDNILLRTKSIMQSMTSFEKGNPDIFGRQSRTRISRIQRIAKGSGNTTETVEELIKQFFKMKEMISMFSAFGGGGDGLMGKIPGLKSLSKMANLAKMARQMGGMQNIPGVPQGMDQGLVENTALLNKLKKQAQKQAQQPKKKKKSRR